MATASYSTTIILWCFILASLTTLFIKLAKRSLLKEMPISFLASGITALGLHQLYFEADPLLRAWAFQSSQTRVTLFICIYYALLYFALNILKQYGRNLWDLFIKSDTKKEVINTEVGEKPDTYNNLQAIIGEIHDPITGERTEKAGICSIKEKGLSTGLLIMGSIGSGKTVLLESILNSLLEYRYDQPEEKMAAVLFDEKGDFHSIAERTIQKYNRMDDLITFSVPGDVTVNFIHDYSKSDMELANRLKLVMTSTVSKGYDWIAEGAKEYFVNVISLVRLTSKDFYVTLSDVNNLMFNKKSVGTLIGLLGDTETVLNNIKSNPTFLSAKIENGEIETYIEETQDQIGMFFDEWFVQIKKGNENVSIITRAIKQLLIEFVHPTYSSVFCPKTPDKITFEGFKWLINNGKIFTIIVPDSMKIYVTGFFKMLFQEAALSRAFEPTINKTRQVLYMHDECQDTLDVKNDNKALNKLRDYNVIYIYASQNASTLATSMSGTSEKHLNRFYDNFRSTVYMSTKNVVDQEFYSRQCNKEEKTKTTTTFSESTKKAEMNALEKTVAVNDSTLNKSISENKRMEAKFESSTFKYLNTCEGVIDTFDGFVPREPFHFKVKPTFIEWEKDYFVYIDELKKKLELDGQL